MRLRDIYNLLRNLFYKKRLDEDLDEELRSYIQLSAEERVRCGARHGDALAEVQREVGGVEQLKEDVRDVRAGASMDSFLQDLFYGLRVLKRNPGFAAVAIATLALGIGATTAIFSVVDAVMLKPLPFPTADRLVRVESRLLRTGLGDVASYPDFLDWRARNHVFDGIAAFRTGDFTFTGAREAEHLEGAVVSADLFRLLGMNPALGRTFLPKEDNPAAAGGADAVILSYSLWAREFGKDASVLGRTIRLSGQAFTVVGVMPEKFQFPIQADPIELWTTIAMDGRGGASAMTAQRGAHYLDVIGLLKPGVTRKQAQAEMVAISSHLSKEHPENKPRTVQVAPEIEGIVGPIRAPLLILLSAVGCVLLISCVNLANLLLARASNRRKEMAIRVALGASRGRATRQLLTENITLALLGGGAGLFLALSTVRLLVGMMPADVPRLSGVGLDGRMLAFAFVISLASGILFGLAPVRETLKISLTDSLTARGPGSGSQGTAHTRLRRALVVAEIALAVVLLLGSSLLLQSLMHLTHVDPGFDPHGVLTFQLDAPNVPNAVSSTFFHKVIAGLSSIPGVRSVSAAASLPLTGDNMTSSVEIEGHPTPLGSRPAADFNAAEPGFFRTIGATLVRGRDFSEYDGSKSTPVVIVNRTFAQRFFPKQDPIGKHVRPGIGNGYGPGEPPMREIVGVIEDIKQGGLNAKAAPEVYAPLEQSPFSPVFITVRAAGDPRGIIDAARREVAQVDKNSPIYHVETLEEYFAESLVLTRLVTLLLSAFAILALILACVGVYGVVSYITAQRTHEIGIRMALGSRKSDVLRMVVGEGLRPALLGVGIGAGLAIRLTGLLTSLLYGVKPTDPLTFAMVCVLLAAVAILASYVPAQQAANLEPMLSLRHE